MSILFPSELTRTQEQPPVATPPAEEPPAEIEATHAAEADKPAEEHAAHPHFHPGKHRDHAVAHPAPSGVSHLDAGSVIFR